MFTNKTHRLLLFIMCSANVLAWGALYNRGACQEGAARALAPPGAVSAEHASPGGGSVPVTLQESAPSRGAYERLRGIRTSTLDDRGLFKEFDDEVHPELPSWIDVEDITILRHTKEGTGEGREYAYFAMTAGVILAEIEPPKQGHWFQPVIDVERWSEELDADQDGIPDQLDILRGALKAASNGARYEGGYEGLEYPGGDVSKDKGVCTDVVIRAMRNAGIDLQVELFEEIGRSPKSFPMVKKRDPNIDQRRVKTLLPYFKRRWRSLAVEVGGHGEDAYLPGDIVFMQTMGDERPDHLGIVSDKVGESGHPLIINNWTDGYTTSEMDLLGFVPVTHRFRRSVARFEVSDMAQRGLQGVLERNKIVLSEEVEQVVLVTTSSWGDDRGELRLYERDRRWEWVRARRRPDPIDVNLGRGGLGKGRGLDVGADVGEGVTRLKREGDGRSPAGVFALGVVFGEQGKRPAQLDEAWPWHDVKRGDVWVDDASSRAYNRLIKSGEEGVARDFASAEDLTMYDLAVVIEHNTQDVQKGGGSAIFLHTLAPGEGATAGCTSMPREDLLDVVGWLKKDKKPVFVQVVGEVF